MAVVYLFRGKHPLYETFVSNPPDGVEYVPQERSAGAEEYRLYRPSHSMIRRLSDISFEMLALPRLVPVLRSYELVHSSRGFIPVGPNDYVVDIEHASSFVGMKHSRLNSDRTRRVLTKLLTSPKCCRILPHCEAAMKTLPLIADGLDLTSKATVLYPTVDCSIFERPRELSDPPHLLFMGEYFWKGGRELIRACIELSKRLDFRLTYISLRVHPPRPVIESARKEIKMTYIEGPLPRKSLIEEVYPTVDTFVMPTYIDTFGYAFLEAMACGIPCVGSNHFAVPEIVQNEITGLIVHPPISFFDARGMGHPEISPENVDSAQTVSELRESLSRLIESRTLRDRFGARGRAEVLDGKFSVRTRNAVLKEVYGHCGRRKR